MSAYITATGAFLPGYPVTNDEIEDYIGKAGRASSDLKDLILANCGIKTRHYAIGKNQQTVISNAAMAAEPVAADHRRHRQVHPATASRGRPRRSTPPSTSA